MADFQTQSIFVLGSGNFGTCLSQHLARKGHHVTMWTRCEQNKISINQNHKNKKYLTDYDLHHNISATCDMSVLKSTHHDALLIATPTQFMRQTLKIAQPYVPDDIKVICATKGIENKTLCLPMDIVCEEFRGDRWKKQISILSGPSFANEVVRAQPTAVSVASVSQESAKYTQNLFHTDFFRAYTQTDPLGLEVAGALKNVIAIASGISTGMGFENNARAGLLTRGLSEITRIGVKMGANPLTFVSLGGVGDLFLTSSSEKSRNFRVGLKLAEGKPLEQITQEIGSVAEGIATTESAYHLARKINVTTPITDGMYDVLYNKIPIKQAIAALLSRNAKDEFDLPKQLT